MYAKGWDFNFAQLKNPGFLVFYGFFGQNGFFPGLMGFFRVFCGFFRDIDRIGLHVLHNSLGIAHKFQTQVIHINLNSSRTIIEG